MRFDQMNPAIRNEAETLAAANVEAEPDLQRVYLFPSNDEVRLIEVDPNASPSRSGNIIAPFYFGSSPESGLPFPCAIALIRPEEKDTQHPPAEWGSWAEAHVLWEAHPDAV